MPESEGKSEPTFDDIISSKPFRFTVGQDGNQREFTMHSALVASLSKPLNALVNGPMSEARDCHVIWDDICPSTFVLFAQWAYNEVDNILIPRQKKPAIGTKLAEGSVPESGDSQVQSSICPDNLIIKGTRLWDRLVASLGPLFADPYLRLRTSFARNPWDFKVSANLLLSQGRLYVFADRYQIQKLQNNILAFLVYSLQVTSLHARKHKEILGLLLYCYVDEPVPDRLKDVVILFSALHMEDLWKYEPFRIFYGEQGEFATAVTTLLVEELGQMK